MYDYACSCFINDTIDKNEILEVQKDFEKMKSPDFVTQKIRIL